MNFIGRSKTVTHALTPCREGFKMFKRLPFNNCKKSVPGFLLEAPFLLGKGYFIGPLQERRHLCGPLSERRRLCSTSCSYTTPTFIRGKGGRVLEVEKRQWNRNRSFIAGEAFDFFLYFLSMRNFLV